MTARRKNNSGYIRDTKFQGRADQYMIDASDEHLVACVAELTPRHELIVGMALNGCAKNLARHRQQRIDALMRLCDSTAKMAKLLTEVRKQGKVIEAWAADDDRRERQAAKVLIANIFTLITPGYLGQPSCYPRMALEAP
jgi:hypothetical protein